MEKKMTDEKLAGLLDCLRMRGETVTTVESCTGGLLSGRITDIPGSSDVFREGFVTYCDEAKHELVGVQTETLRSYTAVSAQTAREMALGGAEKAHAQACLSVTGYAGSSMVDETWEKDDLDTEKAAERKPDQGSAGDETGLVYVGCAYRGEVKVKELHLRGSRRQIRAQAMEEALLLLKESLADRVS